jgi:hypothetical protein
MRQYGQVAGNVLMTFGCIGQWYCTAAGAEVPVPETAPAAAVAGEAVAWGAAAEPMFIPAMPGAELLGAIAPMPAMFIPPMFIQPVPQPAPPPPEAAYP